VRNVETTSKNEDLSICLCLYEDMEHVMTSLTSYDRDTWAAAFSSVARPYEIKTSEAEITSDAQGAKENYFRAYQYYRLARYPTTNSDGKKRHIGSHRKCSLRLLAILTFQ
jgi:esterase FrsA